MRVGACRKMPAPLVPLPYIRSTFFAAQKAEKRDEKTWRGMRGMMRGTRGTKPSGVAA